MYHGRKATYYKELCFQTSVSNFVINNFPFFRKISEEACACIRKQTFPHMIKIKIACKRLRSRRRDWRKFCVIYFVFWSLEKCLTHISSRNCLRNVTHKFVGLEIFADDGGYFITLTLTLRSSNVIYKTIFSSI